MRSAATAGVAVPAAWAVPCAPPRASPTTASRSRARACRPLRVTRLRRRGDIHHVPRRPALVPYDKSLRRVTASLDSSEIGTIEPSNELGPPRRDDPFAIVFVCSGNRFRSPLAEHLMRDATEGLPVRVSSVGTLGIRESPALDEARALAREVGIDLDGHRSRPLRRELVEHADLVLGFERRHVAHAVVDGGVPRERAFTVG